MEILLNSMAWALIVVLLFAFAVWCPPRVFKQRFPKYQFRHAMFRNLWDYYSYCLKARLYSYSRLMVFLTLLYYVGKCSVVLSVFSAFWSALHGKVFFQVLAQNWLGFLVSILFAFFDIQRVLKEASEAKSTTICIEPDAYKGVSPPNGWQSVVLRPDRKKLAKKGAYEVREEETIIVNKDVDNWLFDGNDIALKYNRPYSQQIKHKLWGEKQWKELYKPFLRCNFFSSMYGERQFYNELKFGISQELVPNMESVTIHKTCYYDFYLTNIIPGKTLRENVDSHISIQTDDIMPFDKARCLRTFGDSDYVAANEVGVTTLFPIDGKIVLWRQNRLAQGSVYRIAPSGSGGMDWNDCVPYLPSGNLAGDSNGFRKAIVYGMQRELWEESYANREITERSFMEKVETVIIGYFRWLDKAGTPEFIGVTRVRDGIDLNRNFLLRPANMQAESAEIQPENDLVAESVGQFLDIFPLECDDSHTFKIKDCSVPYAAALLRLRELCDDYCRTCSKKVENCHKHCAVKLEDAVFSGRTAIRVSHPKA